MIRSRNALLLTFILWIGFPLPSAFAHAGLISSTPKSGAQLTVLPAQVELEFGENLLKLGDAQTNLLVVKDSDGIQVDKSDSSISGRFLIVSLLPSAKDGVFTANWRIVSEDGHPVEGSFQFSVTSSQKVVPAVSPTPLLSSTPTASTGVIAADGKVGLWRQYRSQLFLGLFFLCAVIIWIGFKGFVKR